MGYRGIIAVSNTTPLRYLISIEHNHLLGKLFDKVIVPADSRISLS